MTPFETEIEGIVDSILEDYTHGRDIDRIDLFKHPDKDIIIDMIDKLRRIVFPGYFTEKTYRIYNAKHNLSMLIEDVMFNLNRQVGLVIQDKREAERICLAFSGRSPKCVLWYRRTCRRLTTVTRQPPERKKSYSPILVSSPSRSTGWRMCCISWAFP